MGIYQLPKIIGKDKKPPFGARINPHHPLSKGLVYAFLFNEGGGQFAFDTVLPSAKAAFPSSDTYWINDARGNGVYFNKVVGKELIVPFNVNQQSPLQICIFIKAYNIESSMMGMVGNIDPSYNGWSCLINNNWRPYMRIHDMFLQSTTAIFPGEYHSYGFDADINTGINIYLDGKNDGVFSGTGTYKQSAYNLLIGQSYLDGNDMFYGNIYSLYIYNRSLTAGEHYSLHTNPYQMFLNQVWDAYIIPTAAPPPTGGRSIFGYDSIFHAGGIIQT